VFLFQEALSYVKRREYESTLLRYISKEFAAIDARLREKTLAEKTRANEIDEKEGRSLDKSTDETVRNGTP